MEALTAAVSYKMRELAHWRWDIENNGFKALNSLGKTKHLYAHDPNAAEAVTLILFRNGNVLQLFLAQLSPEPLTALFGKVKLTRRFLQQSLRDSLVAMLVPDTS